MARTEHPTHAGSRAEDVAVFGRDPLTPAAQGLYDPANEHDSCGVGFVANLHNVRSHAIVEMGLQILLNLDHRGAVGADPKLGDGCGILLQIPHAFFAAEAEKLGVVLPAPGEYAIGQFFLPRDGEVRAKARAFIESSLKAEDLVVLGWRDLPIDSSDLGDAVRAVEPFHAQVFVGRGAGVTNDDDFERRCYLARKTSSSEIYALGPQGREHYSVSLSSRTIVYKGMVLVSQLGKYFLDLKDERFVSALALVHQRFATNTFPSWRLAHPYRFVAHNGEINTLRGNLNWMAARQASVASPLFGKDINKLWPISYEGQSDTACFDNALEFLVRGGYSLAHAVMMLIPEAWSGNPLMDAHRKAFYEYHAALMEPWDGPAAMAFTDGRQIGATLDRNGLRPARYLVTDDGLVVMASEMGVLPIPEEKIITKWRLQPGKMLLVDLEKGRIVSDDEIKTQLTSSHPYREWLARTQIVLEDLKPVEPRASRADVSLLDRQQAFGYTQEDLDLLVLPMAVTGQEAVGSMGTDTPISPLSEREKLLYTYFKQNFAQVTNPPIDPIREELVMSLVSFIGPRPNILDHEGSANKKRLEVRQPILTDEDLEKIRCIGHVEDSFDTKTLDFTYDAAKGADGLDEALRRLCERAEEAVNGRYNIIVLSDRMVGPDRVADPGAARHRRRASPFDPQGSAHLRGPCRRDRRGARGAPFRLPRGLRRRGDQPLSGIRNARRPRRRAARRPRRADGDQALYQGGRQGTAQGHVQNGHFDLPILLRRADFRRRGPVAELRRRIFPRHDDARRGRRPRGNRARDRPPPPSRLWRRADLSRRARCRRRLRLSHAGRGP